MGEAPLATYRLQFHKDFTFRDAAALVDYLSELGISHVYASPILKARPGSTHGYDIVDHDRLNPELGSAADFDALVATLHAHGMGLVLDIVPNHMGVGGRDNAWWLDVLEWGTESPYARYFDIDWHSRSPGMEGRVLLPVLGDQYGTVLARGEIRLRFDAADGSFSAWYYDHRLPIDPRDYPRILDRVAARAEGDLPRLIEEARQIALLVGAEEAYERSGRLKRDLAGLAARDATGAALLAGAADAFNGRPGDLDSWMGLHALIEAQSYRPAYWRVAADEINYRRFFNINDLAGVRAELPEVFEATHRLLFRLIADGKVDALRIDHIDGLYDPQNYCEAVRGQVGDRYVVVEKILASHERLAGDWPIAGTSGYDALNLINGLFVDPQGEARLDRFWRRYTRRQADFDAVLYESKKRIMRVNLASEMNVLASELHRLSAGSLATRDFTFRGMREAIEEVFAQLPVYRTYVTPRGTSEQDRRYLDWAVARAKRAAPAADTSIFDFLHRLLSGDLAEEPGYEPQEVYRVAMRAQQISGPVMAKGMEDTAFYRYFRLLSLNEVGGDPRRFGISPGAFHHANRERLEHWPQAMLALATHDTKRGEDARARLNVLSEIPAEWGRAVMLWTRINRSRRGEVDGSRAPERSHEYLFYQALLGAWPAGLDAEDAAGLAALAERLEGFMVKALREGKERSSWSNSDLDYEAAVGRFVRGALLASPTNAFPRAFGEFVERVARAGAINSLAQTLVKLTMPGVPDTYRGSELWDFDLVDPDNRRPVDYRPRRLLLEEIGRRAETDRSGLLRDLACRWREGSEKLFLIRQVLRFRQRFPRLFAAGDYEPVAASGEKADHVFGFVRQHAGAGAITLVPRLSAALGLAGDWGGAVVHVPCGSWRDLFTGRQVAGGSQPVGALLREFPVAVLYSTAEKCSASASL